MPMPSSRTVPALLEEMAERHGDREALVGDGRRWTYRPLRDAVRAFAKGLQPGYPPGQSRCHPDGQPA